MSQTRTDVVVVGLGTMGSMAAWQLAERGVSVVGVEARGRVHSQGSFTGESRLFRVAAKEGVRYVPALVEARKLWLELGERVGRDLLLPIGALSVGAADRPEMVATLKAIRDFGLEHEVFTADELRQRYPQFHVEDTDQGILDLGGGGLRPELTVASGLALAEEAGADLRFHTPVVSVETVSDGVVVHTESGSIHASHVVVAAGSWASRLNPELGRVVQAQPFLLTWFMPRHLEWFTPDVLPVFMRDLTTDDLGEIHIFGAPSLDGYALKVCPAAPVEDLRGDVETLPSVLTPEQLTWLGERAVRAFPDLLPEPVHHSLHHDGVTPDSIPVLDRSADGRVITFAGFSGNGFKFAPLWGRVAAELALDGTSEFWREEYSLAAALEREAARAR
ncbi:MAG: N-methyl-L-tryptophan oxidase [Galactobacter sp.]